MRPTIQQLKDQLWEEVAAGDDEAAHNTLVYILKLEKEGVTN